MNFKKIRTIKIDNEILEKLKWIALGLLLFCLFLTSLFPDLVITYTHSLNFLDCVFRGDFLEFYQYTLDNQYYGFPADYYVAIYLIFGIWNLPIWILTKICSIDPYSIGALLWARAIVVAFIAGILWSIKRIFEILEEEQDQHVYFMICSSVLCIFPSFIMGQYDVISLFFIMFGILQCLRSDKVSWGALAAFAIAIPIKTLAIFPVILIILHWEKRILGIIKKIIVSMTGLLLCVLPYINNAGYHEAMTYNGGWLGKISKASIAAGWDQGISLFWLSFFGLCIVAYKMNHCGKKQYLEQIAWLLTTFYVLFFSFTPAHPQWCVLIVPFLMVLIRQKNKNYILNILLETVSGISLILLQAYHYSWVYFTDTTSYLILKNTGAISDLKEIGSLREIFDKVLPPEAATILHAAYLATAAAILFINHPWSKTSELNDSEKVSIQSDVLKLDWLRILIICGCVFATFMIVYVI